MMDIPVDVENSPDATDLTIEKGQVEFKNVTFGYDKNRPVLNNVSFKVESGEKVAILGPKGSGKTSLVYLIPRFYDTSSGRILIDGKDIKSYKISFLRRQIGLVLQDVFIFTGTIKDNVAFSRPDASMTEIMAAAKMARIHDFILTLPQGYDTIVGERGVTLSDRSIEMCGKATVVKVRKTKNGTHVISIAVDKAVATTVRNIGRSKA